MTKTDSRVVPLHDVAEVIDERLDRWVVLVVDVLRAAASGTEGALLQAGIGPAL